MKKIAILLCAMLLCQSCAVLPAEERSFVVALCIETDGGRFQVAARVPGYHKPGDYLTIEAEGDTLPAALSTLDHVSPMRLHYGQVRMVVLGEQAARSGQITHALKELLNIAEFRTDAVLCIAQDQPKSVCDAMNPLTGTRLSKSLDVLLETRAEQGVIIPQAVGEVLRMGMRQCPAAIALETEKAANPNDDDTIRLAGAWLIDAYGAAQGKLDAAETQLLSLMNGRLKKGEISLNGTSIRLVRASSKLGIKQGVATLEMRVQHDHDTQTDEAVCQGLEAAVYGVLEALAQSNCDALGLARYAIRGSGNAAYWQNIDWHALYPQLAWQVHVSVSGAAGE